MSGVSDVTGPIPDSLIGDLEALKMTLAGLQADDLDPRRAKLLAAEIGAIRLHLKRLALDAPSFDLPPKLDD
jgi:hypothetical protein